MKDYSHGWYLAGFDSELLGEITPVSIGSTALVCTRSNCGELRTFSAVCPHRGAHLGHGGVLASDGIICPFHQHLIGFEATSLVHWHLTEFATIGMAGSVFVQLSSSADCGFESDLREIGMTEFLTPGFKMEVMAPAALVIENGFDQEHFRPVHNAVPESFVTETTLAGALTLRGALGLPAKIKTFGVELPETYAAGRGDATTAMPFLLTAYSPGLSILRVSGDVPYTLVIGATPSGDRSSILRVILGLSREIYGSPPNEKVVASLMKHSRAGIELDNDIWRFLSLNAPATLTEADSHVQAFRGFCEKFR